MPELYVGREAPELKRVEGRSVTVKRETTRPMLKLAGSDQNPPLQRQRRKWGYFNEFDTVFPACGSSNSAIELTPDEMEKYSAAVSWIDVCKGWNQSD